MEMLLRKLIIASLLLASFNCSTAFGQISKLFNDESASDSSFIQFKTTLLNAIERKDSTEFVSFFYDTLTTGRYACNNRPKPNYCLKKDFIKTQSHDNGLFNYFSNSLKEVFKYGFSHNLSTTIGKLIEKNKVYFTSFPVRQQYECIYDWSCGLIVGENINLRDAPSLKGKVVKQVSFEKTDNEIGMGGIEDPDSKIWWKRVSVGGQMLYMDMKYLLWAPKLTIITITKKNGLWKIVGYYVPDGC